MRHAAYNPALIPSAAQRRHAKSENCRRELLALERVVTLVTALPAPAMPDNLWAGVAAGIAARPQPMARWWRTAAGMAVAAGLLVGVMVARTRPAPLPVASAVADGYSARHALLSAQDPLADRAGLGVVLISDRSTP